MRKEILHEINAILSNITLALNARRSTVFLINEESGTLDSLISQGIRNNLISMPIDCGIAGYTASTGEAIIVNEVTKNKYFNPYFDTITGFTTHKILCTPILTESGRVVGVIQSLNKIEGDFDQHDLTVLKSFADAISLAIKNAKLYASAESIKNNIATLLKVSSSINSELDLGSLIQLIIEKASEITKSDRSSFFLLDKEENVLWTKFGEGLDGQIIKTRQGLAFHVATTQQPLIENNPYSNPHFDKSVDAKMGYFTKSIISIPVFSSSRELIGVIQSINKKDGEFTTKDLFILNGFAAQISIAIQNSTLFEEINNIKNYLDILFENLDNGILTIDKEGLVKTVNKRFCDILGLEPDALIGKYYKKLAEEHHQFLDYSEYTFRSGEKFEKYNIESTDARDKKLVLNFNALPMKNKDGDNIGVINVIHDITAEERVKENMNRYLPQHVINEIINKDDLSLLNGKYTKCSILFSDLRNFTSLTERLEAIEVVGFLNEYFDIMVESIFEYNGVLDKLIGDAIMATFGIPYNSENDAVNAISTAMSMIGKLNQVRNVKQMQYQLGMGVGIATGNVIAGNIGSKKRFEYTVIGDAVNLSARLESLTKLYGLGILICENTAREVSDTFFCREIDCIKAKGKQEAVTIYTVVGKQGEVAFNKEEKLFLDFYAEGLAAYRNQDFEDAIMAFRKGLLFASDDRPSQILMDRSKKFLQEPPAADWDGSWAFTQK
jgi:adenylate cyclase